MIFVNDIVILWCCHSHWMMSLVAHVSTIKPVCCEPGLCHSFSNFYKSVIITQGNLLSFINLWACVKGGGYDVNFPILLNVTTVVIFILKFSFHSLHGNINVTCMLQVYYIQVACFIMKSVYIFLCNAYITYFNTISPKFVKWKCCLCVSGHLRRVVCGVSFLFELIDVEMSSYIRNNFFCCDKMHIYWAKC